MSERKTTKYNAIVGIDKEGAVYVLDETFEYVNKFGGAVGTKLEIYNYKDVDSINDQIYKNSSDFKYLWQEAVAADVCECGFREWLRERRDELDSNELIEGQDDGFGYRFRDSFRQLSDDNKKKLFKAINAIDRSNYSLSSIFTKFEDVSDFENFCTTNYIGGGRIFSHPDDIDWDVVINPDLIAIYETAEKQY